MKLTRIVFGIAAAYGLLMLIPSFLLGTVGRDCPSAITHPEVYYGFIGVAVL